MFLRLLLCVALAGCATGNDAPGRIAPEVPSAGAAGATSQLYVWNSRVPPAQLDEYPTGGGAPSLRIPSPIGQFAGRSAIDGNGTVYIDGGTPYAPNVSEYKAGSAKPFQTITKGVGTVIGLATDGKNDLYVLDSNGPLVRYAPGAASPAYATYAGLCANSTGLGPVALTADRSGNAYVLAVCGKPGKHAHDAVAQLNGGGKVTRSISLDSSLRAYAMTVDASGRMYVAFSDQSNTSRLGVAEYAAGAPKGDTFFYYGRSSANETGGGAPVVDDTTGVLYLTYDSCNVVDGNFKCTSSIYLFPRGTKTPSRTLSGPADTVLGTPSLDADGNLYVEAESPGNPVRSIVRYAQGTWTRTQVIIGRKLLLGFAWPTVASSRASYAGPLFAGIGGP